MNPILIYLIAQILKYQNKKKPQKSTSDRFDVTVEQCSN